MGKANTPGPEPDKHWRYIGEKFDEIARAEARHESFLADDAEYLVVSFGTSSPFVDYVVEELRADGDPHRFVPADHPVALPGGGAGRRRRLRPRRCSCSRSTPAR